jgi:plasmid stability protein
VVARFAVSPSYVSKVRARLRATGETTPGQQRAAAHRRSLDDEEARELLRSAAADQVSAPEETLADLALRLFGPAHGVELELPPRRAADDRPPPDFSGPNAAQKLPDLLTSSICEAEIRYQAL